jgi:hypothetical protein
MGALKPSTNQGDPARQLSMKFGVKVSCKSEGEAICT